MPIPAIRTILIPTDFSDGSQAAVEYARLMATAFGARIIVVHVIESVTYLMTESLQWVDVYRRVKTAVEPVLAELVTSLQQQGIAASSSLVQGAADEEIVAQARAQHADLIIMGTHGRRGMSRVLTGSVAERVVRTAPCPVLTVRPTGVSDAASAAA